MVKLETYIGHIRNWKALCQELGVDITLPRREREEELIKAAYLKWGAEMGKRIYGSFAFALFDEEKDQLFCLRDPFGTKPFYYYETAQGKLLYGTLIRDIMEQEGFWDSKF